jgi:hypothetical protein
VAAAAAEKGNVPPTTAAGVGCLPLPLTRRCAEQPRGSAQAGMLRCTVHPLLRTEPEGT